MSHGQPPKGGQTGSMTFDDGTSLMMGSTGKSVYQDPPLEEGDVVYRRKVEQREWGDPLLIIHERTVRSVDRTSGSVFIGSGHYDLNRLTMMVNDPTVPDWRRERPAEMPADTKHHRTSIPDHTPTIPEPPTPKALDWSVVCGSGSRTEVNAFLEGGPDGRVDHALGAVQKWTVAFKATYCGYTLSVLVCGPPYNPAQNDTNQLTITRLANHPHAPQNTSSWVLARVREWAEANGYERIVTYAGVGENRGTCYDAAGFELVETRIADGAGRTNRDGRDAIRDGDNWERTKWVFDI